MLGRRGCCVCPLLRGLFFFHSFTPAWRWRAWWVGASYLHARGPCLFMLLRRASVFHRRKLSPASFRAVAKGHGVSLKMEACWLATRIGVGVLNATEQPTCHVGASTSE
ncbi:unnamed protein product, partial [Amoebophrya sp. A120]